MSALARWYARHGRHDLPWRSTRDRWAVVVSEVMLQQTQVARVAAAWPPFMATFPDVTAAATSGPGALITAWGRLGYPRRARRLWEASCAVAREGWPADLTALPGIGRYTAAAVAAQVDDADALGVEVNIRRVAQRTAGRRLGDVAAEAQARALVPDLHGRDRLLALMDLGATVCTARTPSCAACPLETRCATRGVLADEARPRAAPFEGSFRQRRGRVLAALRQGPTPVDDLDAGALASLVADDLACVTRRVAHLPTTPSRPLLPAGSSPGGRGRGR